MPNYTVYHCHTMLSNPNAGVDSVATFKQYAELAKECGMTALAISEHGCFYEWKHKKDAIEAAGLKYIHASEFYVTETLEEKVRDNYHCVLIAKNKDGFFELNRLSSRAYNRDDGHFYYVPRITFEELINTSNNIIVCTACVASILCKGNEELKQKFISFLCSNKDRCFLEIQHHNVEKQKVYNQYLYELSKETGIPLITGTDFHCANKLQEEARKVLQAGKKVVFNDDEAQWDLTWKNYDELIESYRIQNALPESAYLEAIQNTNVMADMVEPFTLDTSFKFPKIYDNSEKILRDKLFSDESIASIVNEGFTEQEVRERLEHEFKTFKAIDSVDYIILADYISRWEKEHQHFTGPARGSAASSLALYSLGVTEVNPLKYGFHFWRFMDESKYSLPDIDTDQYSKDRDDTKRWMLKDHLDLPNIKTSEIITFNTIALRGAIRDVGRGLNMPLETVDEIAKAVYEATEGENKVTTIDDIWRKRYPKLFEYVDLVQGTVTSLGSHPSGVLVADRDIESELGICTLAGDEYPVCVLNMKELDSLNWVKMDELALDTIGVTNQTCGLIGIDRISPKNLTFDDDKVFESIQNDTSLIFQLNSNYGQQTIKKILSPKSWNRIKKDYPSITKFDIVTFVSGLIRPCGKDVYENAVNGIGYHSGVKEIDNLLASTMGYPILQEPIMEFVMKFCGYSFKEADKLRKCVARGTRILMSDGSLKNIEDVRVGDMVASKEGNLISSKKVTNWFNNGTKETLNINCDCGFKICCTKDHKIFTQRGFVEANDVRVGDFVFTPKKLKAFDDGLVSNQKQNNDVLWMLGALIGDGTLSEKEHLCFTNSDPEIINKFKLAVKRTQRHGEPKFYEFVADGKTVDKIYYVHINSGKFKDSVWNLILHFDMEHKSMEKEIPLQIQKYSATKKLASFLAGLFNTDGAYNFTRKAIEYSTISPKLAYQLQAQLLKFGIYSVVSNKKVKGYNYLSYTLTIADKVSLSNFQDCIMPFIVGRKKNELQKMVQINDTYRYFLPERCKKEAADYCANSGVPARGLFLKLFGREYDVTNGFPINIETAQKLSEKIYMPYTYELLTGDFITQRVMSVTDGGLQEVFDIEVEDTHNFVANNIVVHNCIAKKAGTKEQLPIIKKRFEENGKVRLGISQEKSDEIMEIFLGCVLNATRYSFSLVHAVSYTSISYECAWLRYYYPLEFVCCYLNVFVGDESKTNEASEYAKSVSIKIKKPKFRYSKAEYFPDKSTNSIYKGIGSVKFMNQSCADDLYNLRDNHYDSFVDLLKDIYEKTSTNSRQLEILIKLDFFEEFGNAKELLRLVKMYDMFGTTKILKKEKLANSDVVKAIVERHSVGVTKAGKESKSYSQLDNIAILHECETLIMSLGIQPFTIKEKAEVQKEYMGYVDIATGKQEDRPKLYVLDTKALKSKASGKTWAHQITAQSIGSGKQSNYTITSRNYHDEIRVGDVILCKHLEKQKDYWHITSYEVMVGI